MSCCNKLLIGWVGGRNATPATSATPVAVALAGLHRNNRDVELERFERLFDHCDIQAGRAVARLARLQANLTRFLVDRRDDGAQVQGGAGTFLVSVFGPVNYRLFLQQVVDGMLATQVLFLFFKKEGSLCHV
jgi:hypothetical protein